MSIGGGVNRFLDERGMIRVTCCDGMAQAQSEEAIVQKEKYELTDGRILNDVETEFFIRSANDRGRVGYFGLNYCPFCGRPLSRGLWFAEKKK